MTMMTGVESKQCGVCNETKPLTQFGYVNKEKTRLGSRCKACKNKYEQERKKYSNSGRIKIAEVAANCPCDQCAKKLRCQVECLSFRTWVETGV